MISVREIILDDAAPYWQLRQQIDRETEFLRFEPDDWLVTTQHVRSRIELILATDNQTIFVAENEDRLIGFLWAGGGLYRHNHHQVHLILGVLQAYACQGTGTQLLTTCVCWARAPLAATGAFGDDGQLCGAGVVQEDGLPHRRHRSVRTVHRRKIHRSPLYEQGAHMIQPKVLTLHANGSYRDHEAAQAFAACGTEADMVHISPLRVREKRSTPL